MAPSIVQYRDPYSDLIRYGQYKGRCDTRSQRCKHRRYHVTTHCRYCRVLPYEPSRLKWEYTAQPTLEKRLGTLIMELQKYTCDKVPELGPSETELLTEPTSLKKQQLLPLKPPDMKAPNQRYLTAGNPHTWSSRQYVYDSRDLREQLTRNTNYARSDRRTEYFAHKKEAPIEHSQYSRKLDARVKEHSRRRDYSRRKEDSKVANKEYLRLHKYSFPDLIDEHPETAESSDLFACYESFPSPASASSPLLRAKDHVTRIASLFCPEAWTRS